MKKLFRLPTLILMVLMTTFVVSCKKDAPVEEPDPVVSERDRILNIYASDYIGSTVTDPAWTGDLSGCNPGTISADAQAKTLLRIKYFREMALLPIDISFDANNNLKCQQAALMMHSNNALSHTPPASWSCYTADGATAAGSSNIALGMHTSGAVAGFINDFGSNNTVVGHRRWLLFSKARVLGHGSTSNASAIWVMGNTGVTPLFTPEFIAWPPKGYVPAPVVYARWSFGIPGANFANATVTMKDQSNNSMTVSVISKTDNGYGDNTIVWEPTGVNTSSAADLTYHVTVNNVVVGGVTKTYNYDVIIIKP